MSEADEKRQREEKEVQIPEESLLKKPREDLQFSELIENKLESHEALTPLLSLLNEDAQLSVQRNATKALSNFCKGKPQPVFEQVHPALPVIARLLHDSKDEEVLKNACEALSYVVDGSDDRIQAVIESGVYKPLVELLRHHSPLVVMPAVRVFGNLVNGNFAQITAVSDAGSLSGLVDLLGDNVELDIKREAALAISNTLWKDSIEHTINFVNANNIQRLCDHLDCEDEVTMKACLEALYRILFVGEANSGITDGMNKYAILVDEAGGYGKFKKLLHHANAEVRVVTSDILFCYIPGM